MTDFAQLQLVFVGEQKLNHAQYTRVHVARPRGIRADRSAYDRGRGSGLGAVPGERVGQAHRLR